MWMLCSQKPKALFQRIHGVLTIMLWGRCAMVKNEPAYRAQQGAAEQWECCECTGKKNRREYNFPLSLACLEVRGELAGKRHLAEATDHIKTQHVPKHELTQRQLLWPHIQFKSCVTINMVGQRRRKRLAFKGERSQLSESKPEAMSRAACRLIKLVRWGMDIKNRLQQELGKCCLPRASEIFLNKQMQQTTCHTMVSEKQQRKQAKSYSLKLAYAIASYSGNVWSVTRFYSFMPFLKIN